MSPARWTGMPWVALKQCDLSWTPPTWCWLIHQTLPLAAGCECEHQAGADCAHGNRIETLQDTGETKTKHRSNTHQQYICNITYEEENISLKPHFLHSLPSTKRAKERARRSTPTGTILEAVLATSAIPEIPKNRYIVPCCQFISLTHDLFSVSYRWACGPSTTNCSTIIPVIG